MTLQLEVGKYYLNRLGQVRGPLVPRIGRETYPFGCLKSRTTYRKNGTYYLESSADAGDLIQECTSDGKPVRDQAIRQRILHNYKARLAELHMKD